MKMQRGLMDMAEFSNGTILDNIIKYNEELSKKLKVKMDLRTVSALNEEEAPDGKIDMVKALEEKLDNYILEFVSLNNNNKTILEETQEILESRAKDHLRTLSKNQEEAMQKLV